MFQNQQLSLERSPQEKGGFIRLDVFVEVRLQPKTSYLASYRSSRVKFKDLRYPGDQTT